MIFGGYAVGVGDLPIEVESVRVASLTSVGLVLVDGSDPGLPNPQRRDSLFCWHNWTMTAIYPLDAKTRLVKLVEFDPETRTLLVTFDGKLQPGARYELTCGVANLREHFSGIGAHSTATRSTEREQVIQDWANPERSRDTQGGEIGTVQIVGGDYGIASGAASLYERIVHLVQTIEGQMAHDPTYGIEWRQGGRLTVDALQRIQSRLIAKIRQQPDVVRVDVNVGQVPESPGVVAVAIAADTVDGPVRVETSLGRP